MPRLTLRRLAFITFIAGPIGAAGLLAAVALGWLTLAGAILLGLASMILAALGVLGVGVRRVQTGVQQGVRQIRTQADVLRKRQEDGERAFRQSLADVDLLMKDVRGTLGEDRAELFVRLHQIGEEVASLGGRITDLQEHVSGFEKTAEELRPQVVRPVLHAIDRANTTQIDLHKRLYAKIEARVGLGDLITPRAPMPLLGGWALDADIMHMVITMLWKNRPDRIVECGSGSSSIWLGYIAERLETGRVVALEHDERYLRTSLDLIRAHGLDEIVEIRYAPLEPWSDMAGGEVYQWYALRTLEDLKDIGLALVDGPPCATGPLARYPAMPLLLPRCAAEGVIVLDDANRPDEKVISDRWLAGFPELERSVYGRNVAHVFRRRSNDRDDRETA